MPSTSLPKRYVLILLSTAAFLSACGGGSSTPANTTGTDASDKYVGTWKRCNIYGGVPPAGFLAFSDVLVITKAGASSYSSAGSRFDHTDVACAAAGKPIVGESGTTVFTITGTKNVGSITVDTLTYPLSSSSTAKNIAYVNLAGPTLQEGDGSAGLDAAGFPVALNPARFAKQ